MVVRNVVGKRFIMFRILFLLFLVVPIIEIAMLIQISEIIGGWETIAIVILTAYFGAKLVKQQGLQAVQSIQAKLAEGQIPSKELFTGICVLISGVLLVTPGVMTDIIGFLLLTPVFRDQLATHLKDKFHTNIQTGQQSMFSFHQFNGGGFGDDPQQNSSEFQSFEYQEYQERKAREVQNDEQKSRSNITIDGDYERKD